MTTEWDRLHHYPTTPDPVFGPALVAEPERRKGLILSVYRPADLGDCTNGGITAKASQVTVTGIQHAEGYGIHGDGVTRPLPGHMQVFTPSGRAPEVTLVIRDNGHVRWLHLEPVTQPDQQAGTPWMAGGNYAGTSDARWSELCGDGPGGGHPVSVHDRTETWAQYRALSI